MLHDTMNHWNIDKGLSGESDKQRHWVTWTLEDNGRTQTGQSNPKPVWSQTRDHNRNAFCWPANISISSYPTACRTTTQPALFYHNKSRHTLWGTSHTTHHTVLHHTASHPFVEFSCFAHKFNIIPKKYTLTHYITPLQALPL